MNNLKSYTKSKAIIDRQQTERGAAYGVRSGTKSIFRFRGLGNTSSLFENCSSSNCLLSSWRRFHVFESSHPSFHRTVFFGAPLALTSRRYPVTLLPY